MRCWNCDPCWLLRLRLVNQDRPVFFFLRQPQAAFCTWRISARNSLAFMWSLHLKRKKNATIAPASAQMVTQAVAKGVSKELKKASSRKQRSSTAKGRRSHQLQERARDNLICQSPG